VINIEELSPIAHPLAEKKLTKKLHKTIKKGSSNSASLAIFIDGIQASRVRQVKRGVKEVVKGIRKGENGSVFWESQALFCMTLRIKSGQATCSRCGY
jgi:H/ACA ribonucleoprotein complex subunit 2